MVASTTHRTSQISPVDDQDMAKRWLRALKPVKSERRRNRIIRNLDRMDAINQKRVSSTVRRMSEVERRMGTEQRALKQLLGQNRFLTEQLSALNNRVVEDEKRYKNEMTHLHAEQSALMERVDELSESQYRFGFEHWRNLFHFGINC